MPDQEKTTQETPLQPVSVTVIGTGDVTGGPAPMTTGLVATTPAQNQPNIVVTVVGPLRAIAIRFVNNYGAMLLGLLATAMTPIGGRLLYTSDFLTMVVTCASLAFPGPAIATLKDTLTIFARLEAKYPLLTGSV